MFRTFYDLNAHVLADILYRHSQCNTESNLFSGSAFHFTRLSFIAKQNRMLNKAYYSYDVHQHAFRKSNGWLYKSISSLIPEQAALVPMSIRLFLGAPCFFAAVLICLRIKQNQGETACVLIKARRPQPKFMFDSIYYNITQQGQVTGPVLTGGVYHALCWTIRPTRMVVILRQSKVLFVYKGTLLFLICITLFLVLSFLQINSPSSKAPEKQSRPKSRF